MKKINIIISSLLSAVFLASVPVQADTAMDKEQVMRFTKAIAYIKEYSAQNTGDKAILENAMRGMLQGLDAHSSYLDEDKYKALNESTSGQFAGLGIEVTLENHLIKVVSPIDDTPAAKAGIKSGDMIVKINNHLVQDLSLSEAVKLMRGKPNTDVQLTIARKGDTKPIKMDLTREIIKVASVKSEMLPDGYGYLRITQFQENTGKNTRIAIAKLEREHHGKLNGMILDLRNNPGGLLKAAVTISDLFIDSQKANQYDNVIVSTKGRNPGANMIAKASPGDILVGAPLIVLINQGSASASEIVSGALQDYKRAIILGQQSFGKGSVQSVLPLDAKHAIKLTTALYYTPADRKIQAKGITPDIAVEDLDMSKAKVNALIMDPIRESDLKGYIKNGKVSQSNKALNTNSLAAKDYQINQAYNMLRALHIANSNISKTINKG